MCKSSLEALGHEVGWRDATADVEINFIQPELWHWSGVDYRIAYLPWESTALRDGWVDSLNEVDEVWTPSPVIAGWFEDAGVTKPIKVYQHGVEPLWEPRLRSLDGRFMTFHHGSEALRKGGDEAYEAYSRVLGEENAGITFKCMAKNFSVPGNDRFKVYPDAMEIDELVELYHRQNLMLYPSWGEGFGLTPLQAMATGMPVLITQGWAPYEYLLDEHSLIESHLTLPPSSWSHQHPGKMLKPDMDDFVDKLRYQWDNRHALAEKAYHDTQRVHEDYNWVDLTERAFAHLV